MLKSVGKFLRKDRILNSLRAGFMGTQPVTVQGPTLRKASVCCSNLEIFNNPELEAPTFSFCSGPYKLCAQKKMKLFLSWPKSSSDFFHKVAPVVHSCL